jgi:hypothetical protein
MQCNLGKHVVQIIVAKPGTFPMNEDENCPFDVTEYGQDEAADLRPSISINNSILTVLTCCCPSLSSGGVIVLYQAKLSFSTSAALYQKLMVTCISYSQDNISSRCRIIVRPLSLYSFVPARVGPLANRGYLGDRDKKLRDYTKKWGSIKLKNITIYTI